MKATIFTFVTLLFLSAQVYGQGALNESFSGDTRENWKQVHGKVKKIKEWSIIGNSMDYDIDETHYNRSGEVIYKANLNNDGSVEWFASWTYDDNNLLSERHWFSASEPEDATTSRYHYSTNGDKENLEAYDMNNKLKYYCKFESLIFDQKTKETEACFTPDNKFRSKKIIVYDGNDVRLSEYELAANGDTTVVFETTFYDESDYITTTEYLFFKTISTINTYDKAGNLVLEESYNLSNEIDGRDLHIYNTANQRIESRQFDANTKIILIQKYSYDIDDFLVQEVYNDHLHQLFHTSNFIYDSHKNVIERQWLYDGRKQVDSFKFEYDSHWNWTKMAESSDGRPRTVHFREIEYWE